MSGFAWVTLATNDSYSLGALVLAHSLRQVGTAHQLAVLVTPGVTNSMRQKLSAVFNVVQEVNILDSKDEQNLRILKRPELGITFTKLHCWRLTQFEKCIFMDADTLVLVNSDELFEREEFSAAPDVGWPDCFNTGVFVYRPSNETYNKLVDFAMQKGSFDGGDQGLLNLYFSDWAHKDISKHLPFIYNMCSTACYSYMPAFKQYGADVKIVHFVGPAKPWLQYFDTQTRKVQPSSDLQHMQVILQRWWDIFCSLIHPNLSPDMAGSRPSAEHLAPSYPPYQNPSIYSKHINVRNQSVNNEFLRHQKFVEPSQFILNQNVRNIPLRNEDYQRNVDIQKNESDLHSQINYDKPEIQDEFHNVWDPWEEYDEMQYIEQSDNLPLVHTQNLNVELLDSQKNTCSHNNNNQVAYTNMTHHVDMQAKESDFAPIQEQVLPDYTDHTQINYSIHREVEVVENINNYEPIQSDVYNKSNSPPLSNLHSSNYNNEVNQKNIENNTQITCPQLPLETSFPIPGKPALPIECEPSSTISKETVSLRTIDYDDAESIADSGLAGAFAQLTMGVKRTPSQDALENHLRRQAWEVGNVDYMGRDSFDNIWSKICDTLAAASVEKPVEEKSMEQTSSDSTIQEKPVLSVVEPTSKEVTASTTEEFVPQGTPQPENLKEIDVSSLEAKSDISQESKPESTTELSVKTITEVAKETVPEPLMGVKPDESFKPEIPQEDLEIKPTSQPTAATTELKPEAPASEAKSQESVVTEIPKLEETVVETSKGEEKGKVLEPTSSEIPKREETVTETPKSEEKAKEQEPLSSEIHKLEETAIETTKSEEKAKEPEPLSSEIHKLDETVIETPKGEEKDKLQEPTSIETKDVTEIKDQEQLTVAEASKQDESVKSDSKAELSKTEKSPIIVEAVDISKTEDSIKEVPKVIETPKTEPSKTIEPAKLEETVKVEEVSVIDEKPKAEELPKVEELSKVVEESLTKDAKTEETMKTVEVEMGKEEVPKVEETTKLDVSSPEVALKLISPVVESVQEAQETSKLVHKPEPEEAVSQVETQKPEEGKLEVLTEPDKPLKQAPKTEEISKDSSKIKETPKQSPKVEEPLKECPKVEESPKTEETPKVESKEPTKVKKVTKEGKEKKVKKVPKSEVKAEGLQEESVVPEGETSTSQSTETPTPPPRKTASGTKKVKAKKPNP